MFVGECMCICLHHVSLEVNLLINHHLRSERWLVITERRHIVRSSPAKVNAVWLCMTNVQKQIFSAVERQWNHVFVFFFKLLYSAACLAPGISPSWVQRSIFNKHIMKKQACNAAAEWSHHPTYGSAVFHLFVHRRFVCCSSLTATFLPEAFIKDWHGRNGLSGTGSLEPLGSMDALRARFHSERDAATVEGAEADYHSTNKNKAWCETRAKTKGCIRVFPQDEALPTATVCHTEHTQTLTHVCTLAGNGIVAQIGSFIPLEGREEYRAR